MQVGIRELKARLSHYVHQVANGEGIVVTDRGRPIARLVALDDATSHVKRGIDEGWIEAPRRRSLNDANPHSAKESIASALSEDRG